MRHARKDYNRIQDPLGKIPNDEPVFLIRGQDIAGPLAVEAWANIAESMGADARILHHARAHAKAMRDYQHGIGRFKTPDMPENA